MLLSDIKLLSKSVGLLLSIYLRSSSWKCERQFLLSPRQDSSDILSMTTESTGNDIVDEYVGHFANNVVWLASQVIYG